MKKSLLSLSLVVSVVLFSGCGSSSSSDTTPPKFTNTVAMFNVNELKSQPVSLTADDKAATFSVLDADGADVTISGSTLTFTAPAYRLGGKNSYKVKVAAKDSAGNSSTKVFTFNVENVITDNIKADASYIVPTTKQTFSTKDGYIQDSSGLLWKDVKDDAPEMTYEAADAYCKSVDGWRIPTRSEFLNLMDYSKGDSTAQKSLIYNNFKGFSSDNIDGSWVEKVGGEEHYVNHKSGGDLDNTLGRKWRVMCVYGDKASKHTFENKSNFVLDKTTNLEWSKITNSTYGIFADAKGVCPNGYDLPTINQLRSIIDNDRIITNIAPTTDPRQGSTSYSIWSSTEVKNDANATTLGKSYYVIDVAEKSRVTSDRVNQGHHVTCVKKK